MMNKRYHELPSICDDCQKAVFIEYELAEEQTLCPWCCYAQEMISLLDFEECVLVDEELEYQWHQAMIERINDDRNKRRES